LIEESGVAFGGRGVEPGAANPKMLFEDGGLSFDAMIVGEEAEVCAVTCEGHFELVPIIGGGLLEGRGGLIYGEGAAATFAGAAAGAGMGFVVVVEFALFEF
jgi:hypothetical protein